MKQLKLLIILICIGGPLGGQMAHAASRTNFEVTGILESVSFHSNTLTIGGKRFNMATNMTWLGLPAGELPSEFVPKVTPARVGYKLKQSPDDDSTVTSIWLFSRGNVK